MFGKSDKGTGVKVGSTTIITECISIRGDIKGCGTIHIDGIIDGNIDAEQSIVIGEKGIVTGNIKSKMIMVSGVLNGTVICDSLEVKSKGKVSSRIEVKTLVSDGILNADILAKESIIITQNGKTNSDKMQSKNILVNGSVKGNVVASQLLEIGKNGIVEGSMSVKNIKTQEGGRMLGNMSTYMEVKEKKQIANVKS